MISLSVLNTTVLLASSILALLQIAVPRPNKAHILFAIFCGSVAILMCRQLFAGSLGPYQYLAGMGASAICNSYWLLSRFLFRRRNAIEVQHLIVAIAISLLVVMNQGYMFLVGMDYLVPDPDAFVRYILIELTVLLSSCILVLTFWEGCRGFRKDDKEGKAQRILFLSVLVVALAGSRTAKGLVLQNPLALEYIISVIIMFVMVSTQILLVWKYTNYLTFFTEKLNPFNSPDIQVTGNDRNEADGSIQELRPLARKVKDLIIGQSLYLQENLKVSDIARELDVSEYLISKTIRSDLEARNFNQFVNTLRIEHSQKLLADPENKKKSILAISLDSGFASIGPFTRTFKAVTGFTPREYRQDQLEKRQGV